MQTANILPATIEDLPAISALAGVIWRTCYPGIISDQQIEYMLSRMYDVGTMRHEITHEHVTYERLFLDDVMIGFAAWGPSGERGVAKFHKLYLLPEQHGQGHGSKLLRHVMKQARHAGYTSIILNVNKRNAKAIDAYQRNGFAIRASVCNSIGEGFVMDDYVMEHKL